MPDLGSAAIVALALVFVSFAAGYVTRDRLLTSKRARRW
jgi:hypothetical protein